jgi:hypothetical protein
LGNADVIVVSCNTCDLDQTLSTSDEFWKALQQCCNANNSLARPERYTQKPWNLARVNAYLEERGENVSKGSNPEGLAVIKEHLVYRDCARRAFAQADNSEKLRREFLPQAKTSPSFSSHVYKVAPEHIRCLFLHDAQQSMEQLATSRMDFSDKDHGKGVFKYEDLTQQAGPQIFLNRKNQSVPQLCHCLQTSENILGRW